MTDTRDEMLRDRASERCADCHEWAFKLEECRLCAVSVCDDCWQNHSCEDSDADSD